MKTDCLHYKILLRIKTQELNCCVCELGQYASYRLRSTMQRCDPVMPADCANNKEIAKVDAQAGAEQEQSKQVIPCD